MAVALPGPQCKAQADTYPLLMEHTGSNSGNDHVIDIRKSDIASTSISRDEGDHSDLNGMHYEDRPPARIDAPIPQPPPLSPTAPPSNVSFRQRGDSHPRRSPLNSGWWISLELFVNVSQIVAAIVVLSLSRHEKPQAPLFEWVIGYTAGCIATLPHLYWRYIHRNGPGFDEGQAHSHQSSVQESPSETTYTAISFTRTVEGRNRQRTSIISRLGQNLVIVGPRLNALIDHFKMALDCFFAVWFVVGNVWVFGGHSSPEDSPNLYRLCIAFLTFSCVGYAMPFILCATICCCLPCIISVLGFREDLGHTRGATTESINALPTYKFKSKRNQNHEVSEISSEGPCEGGIFAAGTDKERIVSAEDAVCCICLARYSDNDSLRELPCSHFFHTECVDKWLAINALCPLCKSEVANAGGASAFFASASRRPDHSMAADAEDARV